MVLTLDELNRGLPEGLTREQMRQMSSEDWHRLKEDPHAVSDAVRRAHQQYRARFDDTAASSGL